MIRGSRVAGGPTNDSQSKETIFPLHERAIATVLLTAIGGGLYFLAGAWGTVLLWGYAMLFVLPWGVAIIGQLFVTSAKVADRDWKAVAVNGLGLLVISAGWLAVMSFLAYRAYLAMP